MSDSYLAYHTLVTDEVLAFRDGEREDLFECVDTFLSGSGSNADRVMVYYKVYRMLEEILDNLEDLDFFLNDPNAAYRELINEDDMNPHLDAASIEYFVSQAQDAAFASVARLARYLEEVSE